ncbi:MAG: amidohydrolase family protein [Ekhidna sp.]
MKLIAFLITIMVTHISFNQTIYLVKGVRLFDGHHVRENVDVLIKDGIIARISEASLDANVVPIDGTNKTIIPGLINCHVHAWLPYHLKNAMEAGVFAVLDMHTSIHPDSLSKWKLEDGYARFYSTGYAATVSGGHGTQFGYRVPAIGRDRSPKQHVKESLARGSDYIKIIYEPQMPTLTVEQVKQIAEAGRENGLLTVAHISRKEHAAELLNTGINGFAHMWKVAPADQSLLDAVKQNDMFIIPTISVMEGVIEYYESNGLSVPFSSLDTLVREIKRIHDAGITVLAGTDPPNVGLDYGRSLYNELKLFVEAGLTPVEALRTATSSPNKIFQVEDIGIIKEGGPANFILIEGDPTTNIEELENSKSIWINGNQINLK